MALVIHQRSEQLRQEYNVRHSADIRRMPDNLFEMESWQREVEQAIGQEGIWRHI
jgi:hypothetical protein